MMMTTATLLALGATGVAETGYSIYSGEQARKEAKAAEERAKVEQAAAIKEAKDKEFKNAEAVATEEQAADKKAASAAMNLSLRKKRTTTTSSLRGGTILTSPLGLTGTAPVTSGKTLLGA